MQREIDEFIVTALKSIGNRSDPSVREAAFSITSIAGDGSSRQLFRIVAGRQQYVLAVNTSALSPAAEVENIAWIAVRDLLALRGIPVPALLASDLERGFILMDDLGELRLFEFSRLKQPDTILLERLYLDAVDIVMNLNTMALPPGIVSLNPAYTDRFILEMESRYFHDEFVSGLAGLAIGFEEIEPEYRSLAEGANAQILISGKAYRILGLIHRDYQSRNLMLRKTDAEQGLQLVVIDFQGARMGPAEYDLAALLFDPYQSISDRLRIRAICHFLARTSLAPEIEPPADDPDFWQWFTSCKSIPAPWRNRFLANGTNRLMQALGAFAKLGGRLGRPGFVEFIPAGIDHLSRMLAARGDCPRLCALLKSIVKNGGDWH